MGESPEAMNFFVEAWLIEVYDFARLVAFLLNDLLHFIHEFSCFRFQIEFLFLVLLTNLEGDIAGDNVILTLEFSRPLTMFWIS